MMSLDDFVKVMAVNGGGFRRDESCLSAVLGVEQALQDEVLQVCVLSGWSLSLQCAMVMTLVAEALVGLRRMDRFSDVVHAARDVGGGGERDVSWF